MAGRIPQQFIDELLSRVDIVEVINNRVPLKKAGREFQACCPFHGEKTPSFTVSPSKQFYHCFGCGAHGTALGFLMEYDRLSFPEAIEELATQMGMEVPREASFDNGPDHRPIYDLLEKVADYYSRQLREHKDAPSAIDYLKGRGLSGEVAATFKLGFAPPGWDNVLKRFGGDDKKLQVLRDAGLIQEKEGEDKRYDRLRERIIFPIRDGRGRVIGFGGRLLGDGKPKYLNSPETPVFHKGRELYGLYEARQTHKKLEQVLVVEGYMDVVALAQFDIRNAVATLGTATTTEHLNKLYRATSEVVFCFDGDRAGRDAAWKALQTALPLMKDGRQARFLFLPEGEDPDTLVRKIGTAAFNNEVAQAQPLSEFFFAKLESQVDTSSIDGLARMAEKAKPLLAQLPAGTFRDMMEQALQQRIGLKVAVPPAPQEPQAKRAPLKQPRRQPGGMPPVRRAVALLLQHPEAAQSELPAGWDSLEIPGIDVLKSLLERIQATPGITSAALVEGTEDPRLHGHLAQLAIEQIAVQDDAGEQLHGILAGLLRQAEREKRERLLSQESPSSMTDEEKQRLRELYRR
jgi:DNA primase